MMSIIICSRKADIPQDLKDNIAATIGCEYELCVIDNSHNEYNIFSAYDKGISYAKGDVFCFMHEDVRFHSDGWGRAVNDFFDANPGVGLLGVVGGQFIPNTPSSYWEGGAAVGQIIQGSTDFNGQYYTKLIGRKCSTLFSEVAAVDGLWMCVPARFFIENILHWDTNTFHGFHCYDMDLSYQAITNNLKVMVARDILVEHQSPGNTDSVYCQQSQLLYDKWQKLLPFVRGRKMDTQDIQERTQMASYIRSSLLLSNKIQSQYERILISKAYRLGKLLLKPFKMLCRNDLC